MDNKSILLCIQRKVIAIETLLDEVKLLLTEQDFEDTNYQFDNLLAHYNKKRSDIDGKSNP